MIIRSQIFLTILLLLSLSAISQTSSKSSGDLDGAKLISVNKTYTYKTSPKGFGTRQEFPKNDRRSSQIFRQERNTVWLLIPIPTTGIFSFEISPLSAEDDYDWMLFSFNKKFREDLKKHIAIPVRSNNAKNDKKLKGKTGLKDGFESNFAVPGPGISYSKPLLVKKGDTLALIVDNINTPHAGFEFTSTLASNLPMAGKVSGIIFNKTTNARLAGQIVCEDDSSGLVISTAKADAKGNFSINIPLNRPVNITAQLSGYVFKTIDLKTTQKANKQDFALDPLSDGILLQLYNIHFKPDKDIVLPSAFPELQRLGEFLKSNPDYDIKITGHTNNNPFADSRYLLRLSFNRAMAVRKYLMASGISETRISCSGMGGKAPLVITKNAEEAMKNLRVEVEMVKREEE